MDSRPHISLIVGFFKCLPFRVDLANSSEFLLVSSLLMHTSTNIVIIWFNLRFLGRREEFSSYIFNSLSCIVHRTEKIKDGRFNKFELLSRVENSFCCTIP